MNLVNVSPPAVSLRRGVLLLLITLLAGLLLLPGRSARAQSPDEEIVYIDSAGFVRVLDTNTVSGRKAVTWVSPVGGYVNAAVIDANGDGDMEIAALRRAADPETEDHVLDIYDPVVASGTIVAGQSVGGIPWLLLYTREMEGDPMLLAAGELDGAAPGEELFVSNGRSGGGQNLFYLRRTGAGDGRSWEAIPLAITGRDWTSVALGNMDAAGVDEVALVAAEEGELQVWRLTGDGGAQRIFQNESNTHPWKHIAMGRFRQGDGRDMLGAVRTGSRALPTFFVFRYSLDDGEVVDDTSEVLSPGPLFIFFGDVNASGDDEAWMVRDAPTSDPNIMRLIMRQRGNDPVALLEDKLDAGNGYKVGAAGDIDGDGREEVVILRAERARYYGSPESSASVLESALSSDARTIAMGDLDSNGYLEEVILNASPPLVEQSVRSGEAGDALTVQVTNKSTGRAVPIGFHVEGSPAWVSVSANSRQTPATLAVTFDASRLRTGIYAARLLITSADRYVLQQPVFVDLKLTVTAGLFAEPAALAFVAMGSTEFPCSEASGVQSMSVDLVAEQNTIYTAALLNAEQGVTNAASTAADAPDEEEWPSTVPWATATSPTGVAPENLTVSVDFAKSTAPVQAARVVIIARVGGEDVIRTIPVTLFCATTRTWLPLLSR